MRTLTIILLGIFSFQFANAQDSLNLMNKKNEINIGYLNVISLSSTDNFGIGYKYKIGDGALRFRLGLNFSNQENKTQTNTSTYKTKYFTPKIGYEFKLNYKRSVVFYGIDLCASYSANEYKYTNNYYTSNTGKGIGLSPFIGFKYFINKNISLSTETSFDFLYTETIIESGGNGVSLSKNKEKTMSGHLSPLGIFSINFHF